jgi:hypothetical protein
MFRLAGKISADPRNESVSGDQSQIGGKHTEKGNLIILNMLQVGEFAEIRGHAMQAAITLPRAFSARDEQELRLIQDLVTRLNPRLLAVQVATGLNVNGGCTVNWGLVYMDGQPPTDRDVQAALEVAGLDLKHNAEIQPSRTWADDQPRRIEKARD